LYLCEYLYVQGRIDLDFISTFVCITLISH